MITPLEPGVLKREADLVFLALPDMAAAEIAPTLIDEGVRVIDLSGAFRLRDQTVRARWYPESSRLPADVAYGLTEHEREAVRTARLVANPGCYPTAALLPLAPLAAAGVLVPGADVIVDAKSGVSGAGKTPSERTHFSECYGSLSAYGVFAHRHGAEIEQGLGRSVTFTPHLVPLDRGILATIYVRVPPGTTEEALGDIYERAYAARTVRAPRGRRAAGDQARRAHELLRHWLARGPVGSRGDRVGHRQSAEGRVRPGRAEHERDARHPRDRRTAVSGPLVVKFGGELLEEPGRLQTVVAALARIVGQESAGVVIVHGGGKEIDAALKRAGIEKRQVDGLRITDEQTLDVVVSVLAGAINTRLVAALSAAEVAAVGLTGVDGRCGLADLAPPHRTVDGQTIDLGRVGIPSRRGGHATSDDAHGRSVRPGDRVYRPGTGRPAAQCERRYVRRSPGRAAAGPATGDRRHDARRAGRSGRNCCGTGAASARAVHRGAHRHGGNDRRSCARANTRWPSGVAEVVIVDGRDRAALESAALDTPPPTATRVIPAGVKSCTTTAGA